MIHDTGNAVYMTGGDFGVPVPYIVSKCCDCCGEEPLPNDVLTLSIMQGDEVKAARSITWGEIVETDGSAVFEVALTDEESKGLPVGYYHWLMTLARRRVDGAVKRALDSGPLYILDLPIGGDCEHGKT